MKKGLILVGIMSLLMACQHQANTHMIKEESIQQALTSLQQTHPNADLVLAERGVRQVAALWQEADGTEADFVELVTTHYAATAEEKKVLYNRLSHILEQCGQSADLLPGKCQALPPARKGGGSWYARPSGVYFDGERRGPEGTGS